MRDMLPARILLRTGPALLLVVCLLSAGCLDSLQASPGPSLPQGTTGDLRAYFLDVGQGDSSVILFKDKVILIDAGETDYGDTVVDDLHKLGVEKIDLLVATHPHSDHIGGMKKVLSAFPVETVLDAGIPSSSSLYEQFLATIERKGITYVVAEQGQTIELDPSLRILVLSPPKDLTSDDINTNSIVLRVSYGTMNLLYAGDATKAAEDGMVRTGYPLDAQVLKVGHHGSSGSNSAAFLSRVSPKTAVISLGAGNDYGHPHKEAISRLAATGTAIYRTDEDGTILVQSNGADWSVVTEKETGNFWSSPAATPSAAVSATSPAPATTASPAATIAPLTLPTIPSGLTVPVPSFTIPPVQIGNTSAVRISAVQFNAPGDDRENLNGEWVRITNGGDATVLLAGWTLSDKDTAGLYTFPAYILLPGESVTVYTGSGIVNETSLFMYKTEPVFANSGDEAVVRDGNGNIIDRRSEA